MRIESRIKELEIGIQIEKEGISRWENRILEEREK